MASLTGLFNSPVTLLAVHGYHPFTPDMNIFGGGYQSFIYPTPTTMIPTQSSYDPRLYTTPFPTPYTPQIEEDKYLGIGKANPGTYYNNPGHIFSLIDTYARMSCGLRILQAIRNGSTESEFNGAVDYNIILNTFDGTKIINTLNLTENPSKYIMGHVATDNDKLICDPRSIQASDETMGVGAHNFWSRMAPELAGNAFYHNQSNLYIPNVSLITFIGLFDDVLLTSYFNLPEQFHNLVDLLYDYADNLTSLDGGDIDLYSQNVWTSRNDSKVNYCSEWWANQSPEGIAEDLIPETTPFPLPPPLIGDDIWPSGETSYSQALISPVTSIDTLHYTTDSENWWKSLEAGVISEIPALIRNCYTRLNPANAIKLLTGEDIHPFDSTTSTYEHKAVTELNGVINLIPIQSVGMQYTGRCHRLDLDARHSDGGNRWTHVWSGGVPINYVAPTNQRYGLLCYPPCNFAVVYSIIDVCFHITVPELSSLTISVTGSLDRAGRLDPLNHPLREETLQLWTYDWISRKAALMTSVTNKYNWDRKWHDLPLNDDTNIQTDEILIGNPTAPFSKRIVEKIRLYNPETGFWYWKDGPFIDYGFDGSKYAYYGQPPNWEEKTIFEFNSDLDLKPGCNCVRARFIVQNLNQRDSLQLSEANSKVFVDDLEADITISLSDNRISPISHHFEIKNPPTQRLEEIRWYLWGLP